MSEQEAVQDPSMEDILTSIRKIISDDDEYDAEEASGVAPLEALQKAEDLVSEADKPAPVAPSDDDPEPLEEELNWDAALEEQDQNKASPLVGENFEGEIDTEETTPFEMKEGFEANDIEFTDEVDPPPEPEPEPEPASPQQAPPPLDPPPRAAPRPQEAPAPSLGDEHLLSKKADAAVSSAFGSLANTLLTQNPRTVEDLVRDLLRPMLKQWLDDNLPSLVERLVQQEIERVRNGS